MLYLNENDILKIGIDWNKTIDSIKEAVRCYRDKDYSQPIKPYLRYRDLKNRIIAMPAFLGGNFNISGIKWIASFPKNIESGKPRANSIIILNNANTGEVISSINTSLISTIRTASVSGLVIKNYIKAGDKKVMLADGGKGIHVFQYEGGIQFMEVYDATNPDKLKHLQTYFNGKNIPGNGRTPVCAHCIHGCSIFQTKAR